MVAQPTTDRAALEAEITKYRKAVEENPDSRYFAPLADALRRKGELKEAITVSENGLKKHPKYLSGIVVLAQVLKDDRQHQRALELFNQAVRINPENITAQRGLAEIYDHIGDHQNALKAFGVLALLDPADQTVQKRLQILEATSPRKPAAKPPAVSEAAKEQLDDIGPLPAGPGKTEEMSPEPTEAPETAPETPETSLPEDTDASAAPAPETAPLPADLKLTAASEQPAAKDPPIEEKGSEPETRETATTEETGPAPVKPSAPAARPRKQKRLSEEEKLDLFFNGVDPAKLEEDTAPGFVVKSASEAFAEDEPNQDSDSLDAPPQSISDLVITASPEAKLLWEQGKYQMAIETMIRELRANPGQNELADDFLLACQTLGLNPEKILLKIEQASSQAAAQFWEEKTESGNLDEQDDEKPRPEKADEQYAPPSSPPSKAKPKSEPKPDGDRIQVLKTYLGRIKKEKSP